MGGIIPFLPMIITAAVGAGRKIIGNRQAGHQYDYQKKHLTDEWNAQEAARIQRAKVIQQIISSNPRLAQAASALGPDYWNQILTPVKLPDSYFPKHPPSGIGGDLLSGLEGLFTGGFDTGTTQKAFDELQKQIDDRNQYPTTAEINGSRSGSIDGMGGGGPTMPDYNLGPGGSNEINVIGNTRPTTGGGYGSNVPEPGPPTEGAYGDSTGKPVPTPVTTSTVPGAPPVLGGLGLSLDPKTGHVVNRFGSTVEF